jgi:hypothetical protein
MISADGWSKSFDMDVKKCSISDDMFTR